MAASARRSSAVEPNMPLAKKLQDYKSQNEVLANEFKQLQQSLLLLCRGAK